MNVSGNLMPGNSPSIVPADAWRDYRQSRRCGLGVPIALDFAAANPDPSPPGWDQVVSQLTAELTAAQAVQNLFEQMSLVVTTEISTYAQLEASLLLGFGNNAFRTCSI
ncbi:hypothetical protein PQQ99_21405 [Paraburkholderia sediminicola]|uniref:Uncharacterized protein n=1 Tax=Paraburkholderia metrosideri TaxID=580937 RepID=A0ABW9E5X3_9BURK